MKSIIYLLIFSFSFATIITVDDDGPADYSIIQDAIDVSVDGDTVLVNRGFYQENLLIDKSITLASYAIYDNLTDLESWTQYDINLFEWQVMNDNINETIIDGSAPIDENYGSCIIIYNEDECVTPTITGFTIQNGTGTEITLDPNTDEEQNQIVGGGLFILLANPTINYNQLTDNDSYYGGGIYLSSEPEELGYENRGRCDVDQFNLSNNIYDGNTASYGKTLANRYFENGIEGTDEFDMSVSIFDVANCQANEVSPVWVHIESEAVANFSGSESNLCAITAPDVYIDPNIDQECITDGCGTQQNPFKTIAWALAMILPSEDNPVTLHLINGTYSPETGEIFPILIPSYVSFQGTNEALTILDAMGTHGVISMVDVVSNMLSDLTITGAQGYNILWHGGVYLEFSNPVITNVTITNNHIDSGLGGGMYLSYSNPTLTNVTISDNTAEWGGGGIYMRDSSPILTNVIISNNHTTYGQGGGIYIFGSSPSLGNLVIRGNTSSGNINTAGGMGGGIFSAYSNFALTNVTISDNTAEWGGGGINLYANSNVSLNNVTISANTSTSNQGGSIMVGPYYSNLTIANSIIWNNSGSIYMDDYDCDLTFCSGNSITISYSNIEGGESSIEFNDEVLYNNNEVFWLDGNIDNNPEFIDSDNNNFNLQSGSPCINEGNPNLWYQDIDGSLCDMGSTGGPFIYPNFIAHDFGEVGNIENSKYFMLNNFRQSPIIIESIAFSTSSFTTDSSFPMTINPYDSGVISINALPTDIGFIEDNMELMSPDLPQGISIGLSVTGSQGNLLSGNLSGVLPSASYRITGDISILNGDELILNPGTEFLFDGEYNFIVEGILKAQGTEQDSIVFDSYNDEYWDGNDGTFLGWRGFTLNNVTDETLFEYVRISGAKKQSNNEGSAIHMLSSYPIINHTAFTTNFSDAIRLLNSDPILTYVTINGINGNDYPYPPFVSRGIYLEESNPILTNVTISNNLSPNLDGGGIYMRNSSPTLSTVSIIGNDAHSGGGIYMEYSSPILTDVIISNNNATDDGGGIYLRGSDPTIMENVIISENSAIIGGGMYFSFTNSDVVLNNVTISDNISNDGGGIYMEYSSSILTDVIISNNNATEGNGGGIYLKDSNPILKDIIIIGNEANSRGGGMYFVEPSFIPINISELLISDNYSGGHGGGIFISAGCQINLQNSTITTNTVGKGDVFGAGIYADGGNANLINSIVYYNRRESDNGINYNLNGYSMDMLEEYQVRYSNIEGDENWIPECSFCALGLNSLYLTDSGSVLYNSSDDIAGFQFNVDGANIIGASGGEAEANDFSISFSSLTALGFSLEGNVIPSGCGTLVDLDLDGNAMGLSGIIIAGYGGANLGFEYYEESYDEDCNISVDPEFLDIENGNFHLQEGSPCIDTGVADIDGDGIDDILDYLGLAPDMGAFEFGDELSNDEDIIPINYYLKAPYPNPFNPSTTIEFTIPNYSYVSIQVYDIRGRLVSTLTDNYYNPGYHQIKWDGKDYSSGIYFIRMVSENFVDTQKLMLIK